ncbi:hypothetical protein L2E82_06679 [Cichorium intybus]|uniref:Uncharacterized protein n=1 Tax=Cichorium intybus TaxID=13427 RepID=A0ACB9HA82_CICIN|nr:hypothetical protein L2E82_06679 [Cichorium intybus]
MRVQRFFFIVFIFFTDCGVMPGDFYARCRELALSTLESLEAALSRRNLPIKHSTILKPSSPSTILIIDESNPSSGISINVFAETFEKLPHVESTGDIIQFSQVVIKADGSEVNTVFNKKFSSFALYEGKESSNFVLHPTPNTSELTT